VKVTTGDEAAGASSGLEALDWAAALEAMDGDPDLLRMVVEAALEECPRQLQALRQAIADGHAPLVRRLAHTLKGSLRMFGLPQVTEHARQLESLGEQGDLTLAPAALALLAPEVAGFLQQLQDYLQRSRR
jgi:two-component system, sensor histidine kinase and response regulator